MSELTPFPETIAGAKIVDTQRYPSRPGELPELAFILARETNRPEERAYAVWNASVRDGEWTAFEGNYDMSRERADVIFIERLRTRI